MQATNLKQEDGGYDVDDWTPLTDGEKTSTGFDLARWLMDHGWVDELSTTEQILTRELTLWLRDNVNV